MSRLTLPDAGRITIASAIKLRTFALAVGSGDVAWGSTPPDVASNASALTAPIAMVRSSIVEFVTPNVAGTIEASDGSKWSVSVSPTKYLYLAFVLGFADGPSETLREIAVYLDPTIAGGIPGGQNYIPWASVTAPGSLFGLARFAPLARAGVRQTFGEIITL